MTMTRLTSILFALTVSLLLSQQAHAEFTICNQSLDVFNISVGHQEGDDFETEGWWVLGANRCIDVIRKPLDDRYIYLYVEDVFSKPVLQGRLPACVATGKFLIDGEKDCWQRGYKEALFTEVDTKDQERWTFILRSSQ
jgi:uncharacterized membrane protein